MEKEYVITVQNVKKKFKVYYDKNTSLKEKILFRNRNKHEDRWVLKGVSFKVKKGEAIGIIGKNGCGKSTLLKLLTKIIYPNEGEISIQGRVSSLIELGAGFHPDMSGRENIYTNASIFGLTRKEITERLEKIIHFSELEDFIDNPIRTYSSGMYMRLAFSVAINVDADVLLIDEILAVGDVSFQTKCFEKLKEIKAKGTTIIIVSHSLGQIEQICDKSIWIEEGKIKEVGIPKFVHEHYLYAMEEKRLKKIEEEYYNKEETKEEARETLNAIEHKDLIEHPDWSENALRTGNKEMYFTKVQLLDKNRNPAIIFETGQPFIVHMEYKSDYPGKQGNFGVGINRDDGVYCYGTNTIIEYNEMITAESQGVVEMVIQNNTLLPAKYILDVAIHTKDEIPIDKIHHILEFQVKSKKKDFGVCRLDNIWTINDKIMEKKDGND